MNPEHSVCLRVNCPFLSLPLSPVWGPFWFLYLNIDSLGSYHHATTSLSHIYWTRNYFLFYPYLQSHFCLVSNCLTIEMCSLWCDISSWILVCGESHALRLSITLWWGELCIPFCLPIIHYLVHSWIKFNHLILIKEYGLLIHDNRLLFWYSLTVII